MRPTCELRFVERERPLMLAESGGIVVKDRVLQQWWEEDVASGPYNGHKGEWRDVRLVIDERK